MILDVYLPLLVISSWRKKRGCRRWQLCRDDRTFPYAKGLELMTGGDLHHLLEYHEKYALVAHRYPLHLVQLFQQSSTAFYPVSTLRPKDGDGIATFFQLRKTFWGCREGSQVDG